MVGARETCRGNGGATAAAPVPCRPLSLSTIGNNSSSSAGHTVGYLNGIESAGRRGSARGMCGVVIAFPANCMDTSSGQAVLPCRVSARCTGSDSPPADRGDRP